MEPMHSEEGVSLKDILDVVKAQGDSLRILDSKLSLELSELKQEVHGSSQVVKKYKTETQYKWKFEGNKIQLLFNSEVLEDLTQITWAISNSKLDYARELLDSASNKVKRRNKLIKIADTSEGGWETVRQYESNPVASDSDDENKIIKAETRAIRKRKNKTKKEPKKPQTDARPSNMQPAVYPMPFQQPFLGPQSSSWVAGQPVFRYDQQIRGQPRSRGGCYACGSFAHWRNECPYNTKTTATKSKPE